MEREAKGTEAETGAKEGDQGKEASKGRKEGGA